MTSGWDPVGSLEVALNHAARLLTTQPALAAEQASEILKVVPGHPVATLFLGAARRACGDAAAAVQILGALVAAQPSSAAAHYEYALALGNTGQGDAAIAALRRAVALNADLAEAWLGLAGHLSAAGDVAGADAAYARHIKCCTQDPRQGFRAVAIPVAIARAPFDAAWPQYPLHPHTDMAGSNPSSVNPMPTASE